MNPYFVLGIPDNSSIDVVKEAYRKLAKLYHPDLSNSNTIEKFHAVTEAYDKLCNIKRNVIDLTVNKDIHLNVNITLEMAYTGAELTVDVNGNYINVTIPECSDTGNIIKIKGAGSCVNYLKPSGDLYIHITVIRHSRFERRGKNLYMTVDVDVNDFLKNRVLTVKGIDDEDITIFLPNKFSSKSMIKIENKGMSSFNIRGHIFLNLNILFPELNLVD